MKNSWTLVLVLALSASAVAQAPAANPDAAQQGTSATQSAPDNNVGPVIGAVLTRTLDAKKAKEGDEVVAKTLQEMKSASGVIIPRNSRIIGHVTQAQARGKGQDRSVLAITFDKLQAKDQELPFHAVIQAAAPPVPVASLAPDDSLSSSGAASPTSPAAPGARGGASSAAGTPPAHAEGASGPPSAPSAGAGDNPAAPASPANPGAPLNSSSQGAIGMKNIQLAPLNAAASQPSMFTSTNSNVRLESGTRLVLRLTPQ